VVSTSGRATTCCSCSVQATAIQVNSRSPTHSTWVGSTTDISRSARARTSVSGRRWRDSKGCAAQPPRNFRTARAERSFPQRSPRSRPCEATRPARVATGYAASAPTLSAAAGPWRGCCAVAWYSKRHSITATDIARGRHATDARQTWKLVAEYEKAAPPLPGRQGVGGSNPPCSTHHS